MKKAYLFLTLEGVFSLFYALLIQGPVFTGLAMLFNLDEFLLSVAAAIPPMMQFFQLFASFFVQKYRKRRFLVNVFNAFSRFSFAFLIVFLLLGKTEPLIFIVALVISQIFAALSSSTWNSWMRDLVPPEERGRVFGNRNMFLSIGNALIIYLYSSIVDHFSSGFVLVLLISTVGTVLSIFAMNKIPDVPVKETGTGIPLKVVFKDENFMKFVFFTFYWNMAVTFSSAFYHYHLLKNLGVDYTYIAYMMIVNNFVAMLVYRILGKVSDRVGHKTIAEFGITLASFVSGMWFFMNTNTYRTLMVADAFLSSIAWSAINLSLAILPMEVAFESDPVFFGLNASFASAGSLIGSFAGGITAKFLSDIYVNLHGFEIFGLQLLFLMAGIFRFSAVFFLRKVKVKKHIPFKAFMLSTLSVTLRRPIDRMLDVYLLLKRGNERVRELVGRSKRRESNTDEQGGKQG
ncbi:MAG: hypothetical protein PWP36_778 [Thermotoga sp.]|jgi:MFS family permease|nr:hypothetical protein [Thermotoga sp.]